MAAKVPIRTVYTNSVATGLAEFQSGEFIDYALGGTGLAALGSAGQVLKVNSGASALEYGNVEAVLNIDGMTDGSGITILDADKFAISDGGTEKYITASQLSTYITSELAVDIDSFSDGTGITVAATDKLLVSDSGAEKKVNASQLDTLISGSTATLTNKTLTSPVLNTPTVGTSLTLLTAGTIIFEGATDDSYETTLTVTDPTADRTITLPNVTDTLVGKATTDTLTNKSIDLGTNTVTGSLAEFNSALQSESFVSLTGSETLTNKTLTSPVLNTGVSGSGVADEDNMSSNSATKLATQQSIKAYVDAQITAEDLDVTSDSGTIAIDLDSETLTIAGGTGLASSATSNTVTLAIDSTVATLTGSQTLTNKTLASPVITTQLSIGSAVINEAELETIDGITAGTVAASKAVVVDSNKDIGTFRNLTINGVFTDGNYTFDTSGNVSGLGTVGSGAITSSGVVTATGFTIGSAAITEAELEILDGASVSTTELNYLDITTLGTSQASKAVTVDSSGDLIVPDSDKYKFGAGSDMQLYHDGSNSYITNATGALKIATETSGIALTIGHSTSQVTIADNLTVVGNLTVTGTETIQDTVTMQAQNAVVFEGATADDFETTLTIVDPTADRTVYMPNATGYLPLLNAASTTAITATPAELNYVDGVTSAIQTQMDTKATKAFSIAQAVALG
ncbi:hypothetical protein HX837_07165 [Marine Group I thaumarchaeote]|uniref:Uncharacterized protein n=1 Tax=Marine Group I thaumarchaeote TaxID=2511932 RepID=A0A7K4MQU1_9ARCH|nr:hypothetical protein [Marine Group I thaumarchaeote]